jgi:hypothetical protein
MAQESPLHKLCLRCDADTVHHFIKFSSAEIDPVNSKVGEASVATIRCFIPLTSFVVFQGETPLFYAVRANNRDLVHLLLQMGADAGKVCFLGCTSITLAARLCDLSVSWLTPPACRSARRVLP